MPPTEIRLSTPLRHQPITVRLPSVLPTHLAFCSAALHTALFYLTLGLCGVVIGTWPIAAKLTSPGASLPPVFNAQFMTGSSN